MTGIGISPALATWRTLLALAVVFVMLATTGWTVQRGGGPGDPMRAAFAAWRKGSIGRRHLPSPSQPPGRLASFFSSLTSAQQGVLAARYPLVVGNLDGTPTALRYEANRVSLIKAEAAERHRMRDDSLSFEGRTQAAATLRAYEEMLAPGQQILAFDPTGNGKVAEVFGDLDRARRISVVVPGVDTDVQTFAKPDDWYAAPLGMADGLYRAELQAAPRADTAVIAWADYDAPAGLGMDAATGTMAKAGAVRLTSLTKGLPGSAPVALFCHSYGSVVCGVAAKDLPRRVCDLAVAGSPGMRVRDRRGLHTSARVWATRDSSDWIQDIPYIDVVGLGHGADPVSHAFGARVLSASGAQGHSGYFTPGTTSLRNFADIGVGDFRAVTCARGDAPCRKGLDGPGAD